MKSIRFSVLPLCFMFTEKYWTTKLKIIIISNVYLTLSLLNPQTSGEGKIG